MKFKIGENVTLISGAKKNLTFEVLFFSKKKSYIHLKDLVQNKNDKSKKLSYFKIDISNVKKINL